MDPWLLFLFFTTIEQNIMNKPNFSFYHKKVLSLLFSFAYAE